MNFDLLARYGPKLLSGLAVTMELVVVSIVLGALVAIPITMARLSRNRVLSRIAFAYVYFFRGTPLLAQIFLVYYGAGTFRPFLETIGLWGFLRDAFHCAVLTFTLNTAAYQAEIFRGAVRSVPKGQWEAARSLGLNPFATVRKVVAPQAAMIALRPLGNEIILMVKGSAVASIVTVFDLMGQTRLAFSRTYDMTVYLYAAVLYLIVVEALRRAWNRIEARLTRHLVRDTKSPGLKGATPLNPV